MADWMTPEIDIKPVYGDDMNTERAQYWLTKVVARAKSVAPCLKTPEELPDEVQEAAKGIIVGAVLRLLDDPKGTTQYQTAGPYSQSSDTKLRSDRLLSLADRDELRQLCRSASNRAAPRVIRSYPTYIPR